jgi:hypothetical protein
MFASLMAESHSDLNSKEDSLKTFVVDSIVIERGDAFDDSKAYTYLDSTIYNILNAIHIQTKESVVKKFLLFNVGDTVNLYNLIESERLLRDERYISDASIQKENFNGKNVLRIKTSDNWTLSVPVSLEHPGSEWYYGIGLQENNFLGFGQTVGIYYSHDEFRDMFSALYENTHFLFRHNHLRATYSYNTDGYSAFGQMNVPYLSRSKNQFAYTLEGYSFEGDRNFYASGKMPYGAKPYDFQSESKDLPELNGEDALKIIEVSRLREDSLSFRLGRSFGGQELKLFLTASYDYHSFGKDYSKVSRYVFESNGETYAVDSSAVMDWLPVYRDSRPGFSFEISRIRYDRLKNFHNVKWTEDIDRGYSAKVKISKNFENLGADNADWRLDYRLALSLGGLYNHLSLTTKSYFYFNEEERHDIYEALLLEYIFKPHEKHATVFYGQMDAYKRSPLGKQLYLGGAEGMNGLPTAIFAGQARFYASLEQRYFPEIEIGTVVPVFSAFLGVGEVTDRISAFEPRDLEYLVGLGVRFGMTKSIMRSVSHINLTWPVYGSLERSFVPKISIMGKFSL